MRDSRWFPNIWSVQRPKLVFSSCSSDFSDCSATTFLLDNGSLRCNLSVSCVPLAVGMENIWLVKPGRFQLCGPCCSAAVSTLTFAQAPLSRFSALCAPTCSSPAETILDRNWSVSASKVCTK